MLSDFHPFIFLLVQSVESSSSVECRVTREERLEEGEDEEFCFGTEFLV